MQQTRWAMVGTGLMLKLIGEDFALTGNVDMRVLVSRDAARGAELAATYGFPESSDDYRAVLERDDIDVVYIATPHTEHFPMAMAALDAGKHVLVEKSMTTSAALTRELCEHARSKELFIMEAFWTSWNQSVQEMQRRVAAGVLGEPRLLEVNFGMAPPYNPEARIWAKELGGGSTLDQGVYTLSLAHMLFGTPTSITAAGTVMHGVDAEVVAVLEFAGGQRAVCTTSLRAFLPNTAQLGGSLASIALDAPFWRAEGFTQEKPKNPVTIDRERFAFTPEGNGYVPMLRAVSQAVMEGKLEHELRPHAMSIAVAETMDEVLRQVHAAAE